METVTAAVEKVDKTFRRKRHKAKYIKISVGVGLTVLAFWLIGFAVQSAFNIKGEGVFATLSTLFSAFAFAGVIVTIIMQRDELELQRDEMELQRIEMEGQRTEFEKQNATMKRQRFEATFFNLLTVFNSIRERVGSVILSQNWTQLSNLIKNDPNLFMPDRALTNSEFDLYKTTLLRVYDLHYRDENRTRLGIYFSNFFGMLNYVNDSDQVSEQEKLFYVGVLCSQITNIELAIIAHRLLLNETESRKNVDAAKKFKITAAFDVTLTINNHFTNLFQHNGFDMF